MNINKGRISHSAESHRFLSRLVLSPRLTTWMPQTTEPSPAISACSTFSPIENNLPLYYLSRLFLGPWWDTNKLLFSTMGAGTFKLVPALVHTTRARANSNGLLQYYCGESEKWHQDRKRSPPRKGNQLAATERYVRNAAQRKLLLKTIFFGWRGRGGLNTHKPLLSKSCELRPSPPSNGKWVSPAGFTALLPFFETPRWELQRTKCQQGQGGKE